MFTFPAVRTVFVAAETQERFARDGYVTLPLLGAQALGDLRTLYARLHPDALPEFFPSTFSTDPAYRALVDREVRAVCAQAVRGILQDVTLRYGSFIVKSPGPRGVVNVHQDMTLVDESRFCGINIWCPLAATTPENGPLHVIPGSHRWVPTYRGASIPGIYDDVRPQAEARMQPLPLAAGEAVVFDQSILHFSPANRTAAPRVVINVFLTHREAELRTAWLDPERPRDAVELFAQDPDFVGCFDQFGHDIRARPRVGRSLGLFPYDFPRLDAVRFAAP